MALRGLRSKTTQIDRRSNDVKDPGKLNRLATGVLLLLALVGASGCTAGGAGHFGHDCAFEGYAAWPCFGYHPTCWHPWPGECLPCPSPFLPLDEGKTELVPSPLPGETPMPLPTPEAPLPPIEPAPAPAVPPAQPTPDEGAAADEFSSRRTAENQAQYLQSLRWAPTDNR
jgi:hypothetical protein